MPLLHARMDFQVSSVPLPIELISPTPVITTLREMAYSFRSPTYSNYFLDDFASM